MNKHHKILQLTRTTAALISLLLWPLWLGAQQITVSASLDRYEMIVGETVNLIIEQRGSAQAPSADLSVLDEQFIVLNSNTRTQVNISNGQQQATAQLQIVLQPKQVGELVIPAITVGNRQTTPLRLNVRPAPEPEPGEAQDVVLEVEVEPETPYVQAQITLTLRILVGVALNEPNLTPPQVANSRIEKLGDDVQYRARRNGRDYQVIEQKYAIFPERSGPLEIPRVYLTGRVGGNARTSLFSARNRGRAVSYSSDPIQLEILPVPAEYTGNHWLPAAALQLREADLDQNAEFRVGEPLTRTIELAALGLPDEVLPDIELPAPDGARVYADKPVAQTGQQEQWVASQRTIKQAIVPTVAGTLELPEVRLQWWDILNNRQRESRVPAVSINVLPALNNGASAPETPVFEQAPAAELPAPAATAVSPGIWPYVSFALAALWLMTLLAWWRSRGHKPSSENTKVLAEQQALDVKSARKACAKACQDNDPHAAAAAVVAWAKAAWQDTGIHHLGQVTAQSENTALRKALIDLEKACYSKYAGSWEGSELWKLLAGGLADRQNQQPAKEAESILPELYPQAR